MHMENPHHQLNRQTWAMISFVVKTDTSGYQEHIILISMESISDIILKTVPVWKYQ